MSQPVVTTEYGPVRGRTEGGISRFFGIPYATAPVGRQRFRAPAPHRGWTEVREAEALGPNAPHGVKPFPGLDVEPIVGGGWRKGDDDLNVNIWAPERTVDDPLRPVMVWIHGGGFVIGSNFAAIQDGTAFARSGVVLVAISCMRVRLLCGGIFVAESERNRPPVPPGSLAAPAQDAGQKVDTLSVSLTISVHHSTQPEA